MRSLLNIMRSLLLFVYLTCLLLQPAPCRAAEGKLLLTVVDAKTHKPIACRIHLSGPAKRPKKIEGYPFWSDHFLFPGKITLNLPAGFYTFELERGPEYYNVTGNFTIERFADDSKEVELRRVVNMSEEGWWSGDLHLRRSIRDLEMVMLADDLHVAQTTTWWNDKNDLGKNFKEPKNRLVTFDSDRVHELFCGGFTRAGTEVLCFHLPGPMLLQAETDEYPSLAQHLQQARQKENSELWVDATASYGWDLPMLVANGLVDSIEVANSHFGRKVMQPDTKLGKPRDADRYAGPFGYARWSQDVYFKLLDCGLRIPPTAGSGSGVSPNPAGYNRVYVHLDSSFDYPQWWKNLKAGQVVVTNGPLLRPRVENELPGHTFRGEEGRELELQIGMTLTTREPISYLEIVQDGQVRHTIRFEDYVKDGRLPPLHFKQSGWFLLRAVAEISDTYRFAMTGPYYVEFGEKPRISKKSAQFFLDWVYERAKQIQIDDPQKRREVMEYHRKARDFWKNLVEKATAE
ncbi:MAG: hypothetical protein WCJ35_19110 [Planctomycetota bacterium]